MLHKMVQTLMLFIKRRVVYNGFTTHLLAKYLVMR